jgi:hypothetical protein
MRDGPLPSHCPVIIVQDAPQRHDGSVSGHLDEAARRARAAYGLPSYNDPATLRRLMDMLGTWLATLGITTDAPRRERVVR